MTADKVLIPFNFSLSDERALQFAGRTFHSLSGSVLTLFNAYTPAPEFENSGQTVMGKLRENLSYLNQKINEQENALRAVVDRLVREGWPPDRVRYLYRPRKKDVAAEILDLVQQDGFTHVVLSRRTGRVTRFFTGSVSTRILASAKNLIVCVVT